MTCPCCLTTIADGESACGACGFSLARIDADFGDDELSLEVVTDAADCLRAGERAELLREVAEFQAQFPQLFFAVYFGALPAMASVRQFGFWLLNRASLSGERAGVEMQDGALLVVDVGSMQACLTVSYLLDAVVSESDLESVLKEGYPSFVDGDIRSGVSEIIAAFSRLLRRRGKAVPAPWGVGESPEGNPAQGARALPPEEWRADPGGGTPLPALTPQTPY